MAMKEEIEIDIPVLKHGKWNPEEDKALKVAVEYYGEKNWRIIANEIGQRTPKQCMDRWSKISIPGLIKGRWKPHEDAMLREWVKNVGPTRWSSCSREFTGRSAKQCRERWVNMLNPDINKGKWTPEEDSIIFEMYKKHGSKWSLIAKSLPGRVDISVKNRFFSIKKMLPNKFSKLLIHEELSMGAVAFYLRCLKKHEQILISKENSSSEEDKAKIEETEDVQTFWDN